MADRKGEYIERHFIGHEVIWGKGFMSPGGPTEVAEILRGVDIQGKMVLDLGCGLGGPTVLLASEHGAGTVIGVDIQEEQVEKARALAIDYGVGDRVRFQRVEPGPLPFENCSFDIAFSNGVIVQVTDKVGLFKELYRVLTLKGNLAIGDLLTGVAESEIDALNAWRMQNSSLTFQYASPAQTKRALVEAGFTEIQLTDNTAKFKVDVLAEVKQLEQGGRYHDQLEAAMGLGQADSWLASWQRMLGMIENGQLLNYRIQAVKA